MRTAGPATFAVVFLIMCFAPLNLAKGQGAKQKSWGSICRDGPCECDHSCKKKHCLEAPPFAPILGSTPALMAPIVFTPPRQSATRRAALDRESLRELIELLLEEDAAAAPSRAQDAPQDDGEKLSEDERLDRIDRKLSSLESSLKLIEGEVVKAIQALNSRLKNLEEDS